MKNPNQRAFPWGMVMQGQKKHQWALCLLRVQNVANCIYAQQNTPIHTQNLNTTLHLMRCFFVFGFPLSAPHNKPPMTEI